VGAEGDENYGLADLFGGAKSIVGHSASFFFDHHRIIVDPIGSILNEISGVSCTQPQGTFYSFPDFSGLLNCNLSGVTAATTLALADIVLERAKVAFVPGEAFGLPRYARFSFALGDDDLREGINRLAAFVNG